MEPALGRLGGRDVSDSHRTWQGCTYYVRMLTSEAAEIRIFVDRRRKKSSAAAGQQQFRCCASRDDDHATVSWHRHAKLHWT